VVASSSLTARFSSAFFASHWGHILRLMDRTSILFKLRA
jgi:hypothetical protein